MTFLPFIGIVNHLIEQKRLFQETKLLNTTEYRARTGISNILILVIS